MSFGKIALINLYGCNPSLIKNKKYIKNFIKELCKLINMKPYGKSQIKRFGKGNLEGISAVQFIETSSITIHFDETKSRAFIDIFSCKNFNVKKAEIFSKKYFKADKSSSREIIRT
ncbi:S-adenosylmethionine decarboxylase [Candidatus Pacearchaeota archaeon]|jgi:S-adenosylmethionine/arginine decarboxylase-like enzyme|nr:S-adenosylmethionine decarboxylase [Candidatus Pacearchaeota archaeon]